MSKNATSRREVKLARDLHALAKSNETHLKITWGKLLYCWVVEAVRRGNLLRQENPESEVLPVFDVLKKAERLLALCCERGPEVERLVGAETRDLLNHNCAKAVALAVDPKMYHLNVSLLKPKLKQNKKAISAIPSTSTQGD